MQENRLLYARLSLQMKKKIIFKKLKYFEVNLNILAGVRKCRLLICLCK